MKIRNDFVTNSSSSSYIMAFKQDDDGGKVTRLANALIDLVIKSTAGYDTEEAEIIDNENKLREYIIGWYSWEGNSFDEILSEDGDVRKFWEDGVKYIKNGYKIAVKSVGYDDSSTYKLIKLLDENTDNFILIESEGA